MSVSTPPVQENIDLAPYNTLNVHSRARYFSRITSRDELLRILGNGQWENHPKYVLGGGSNILFLNDFDGLVLHGDIQGRKVVKETGDTIWLKIGAGENWHQTVRYCVEKGWGGTENLSLIPGKVGAAPIQNIGAYGVELSDIFDALTAIDLETGERRRFINKECRFGYRDSIFKNEHKGRFVICDVTLRLSKNPAINTEYGAIQRKLDKKNITDPDIRDISNVVIEIRNEKLPDPSELANAGSFFKNPIIQTETYEELRDQYAEMPGYKVDENHTKVPAGWLIEATGWKGKEVGHTGTYRQQALVIVNHGGASGREILDLSRRIQQSVKDTFNIDLMPEVNIVG